MQQCLKNRIFLLALTLASTSTYAFAGEFSTFGPISYQRSIGTPVTEITTFTVKDPGRSFHIREYAQGISTVESGSMNPLIVISESFYDIDGDGKNEKIEISLVKGRRYDDKELWCGSGEKWEGYFLIKVKKDGFVLSVQSLNSLMSSSKNSPGPLFFHTPEFSLIFKDYNNDGQIDFNLGQYANCNGNHYKLFTIKLDGTIVSLQVKDQEYGFSVSNPADNPNSTDSIYTDGKLVRFSYYSQSQGSIIATYTWNGKYFVLVEEKLNNR